jgi:hypothetical protein
MTRYLVRGWRTGHRGPLAIQAAEAFPRANVELCGEPELRTLLRGCGFASIGELPRGALVGVVNVVECVYVAAAGRGRFAPDDPAATFGLLRTGRWAWVGADAQALPRPVPVRGRLGLFEVPDELLTAPVEGSAPCVETR